MAEPRKVDWLQWLAFSWGACAFFPVGVAYAHLLLVLLLLAAAPDLRARAQRLGDIYPFWPVAAVLAWTLVAVAAGPWLEDTPTRLFHIVRVMVVLMVGMELSRAEARMGIAGFLVGAVCAALVVAIHHVWGLPEWSIWGSLLRSRNNLSSGNMIMMATAAGLFFYLGLRDDPAWLDRWTAWGAALALSMTVIAHALSRNAQALLPALGLVAVVVHFRAWRACAAGLAVTAVLAVAAWHLSPATRGRFDAVVTEAARVVSDGNYTTGVGERWRMASEAWQGMQNHPLLGTGVGSWLPRWREVAHETGGNLGPEALLRHIEINNPHNEYLLAGMEMGVPGLLILVWLLAALVSTGWRARSTAGGATVVLGASVALSALINAPLRDAALGMTLLWLLAVSMAIHEERPGMKP